MPELTHQQAEALRALEWLMDLGDGAVRQSGRSYVVAFAYLRHAYSQIIGRRGPGRWYRVVDHLHHVIPAQQSYDIVLMYIQSIAGNAHLHVEVREGRFRILAPFEGEPEFARHYLFDEVTVTHEPRGRPNPQEVEPRPTSWEIVMEYDDPEP
jgi:hypothetical protein